jgi:uncharacterized HAD superfamily protein
MNKKLQNTWLFDIDGTILEHGGLTNNGYDTILSGVIESFKLIPENDIIILLTARSDLYKEDTEIFLKKNNIRYNNIIFNLGTGKRIIFNDIKPSGYLTAYAENVNRNSGLDLFTIKKYL